MAITIDLRGLPATGHTFALSPLAELAAMLHVLAEPAHHPEHAAWVALTSRALPADLVRRVVDADFLWRSSRADFFLPGSPGALADELDGVDRLEDEAWVTAALLTTSCGAVPRVRAGSPLDDETARDVALQRAAARGPRQRLFVERTLADPGGARQEVRRLLEDCDDAFFADAWQGLQPQLRAVARRGQHLLHHRGVAAALTGVGPGVVLDVPGERLVVDKLVDAATDARQSGIAYLPSAFAGPHVLVVHSPGVRPVIQYPATRFRSEAAGLDELQATLQALSHPVRLRLLRTLARGPHTTGELAGAWNLSAPEVSRHVAVLKEAGLITSRRRGRFVQHVLDREALNGLGTDLLSALLR